MDAVLACSYVFCVNTKSGSAVSELECSFAIMERCLQSLLRNAKDEELHLTVVKHYLGKCVQSQNCLHKHHYSITVWYLFAPQRDESADIADWALLCLYQMCMVRLF